MINIQNRKEIEKRRNHIWIHTLIDVRSEVSDWLEWPQIEYFDLDIIVVSSMDYIYSSFFSFLRISAGENHVSTCCINTEGAFSCMLIIIIVAIDTYAIIISFSWMSFVRWQLSVWHRTQSVYSKVFT